MKKIYNSLKISAFAASLVSSSLWAQYRNGVLIANEGNFGSPNADVSYFDATTQQVTNNVYSSVNSENLGDVLQSLGIHNGKVYMVLNNSNKVVVANAETMVKEATVTNGISFPRYVAFNQDKYYVTNSNTQTVTVYNTTDNQLVTTVELTQMVEEIESAGNFIFVQNGWYASGNTITVINANSDTVAHELELEAGLNGSASDGENFYALTTGADFTHIYKISGTTGEIIADWRSNLVTSAGKITVSEGLLFFTGNSTGIYSISTNLSDADPVLIASVPDSSWSTFYGFNVIDNYAFSGDAAGFTAPSIIKVFNVESGSEVLQFNTTIGANGFYDNRGNLATSDVQNEIEIAVYPNPATEFIQFKGIENAKIKLFNIEGKLIETFNYTGERLNVSSLKSGLYSVVIDVDGKILNKKLLIQ